MTSGAVCLSFVRDKNSLIRKRGGGGVFSLSHRVGVRVAGGLIGSGAAQKGQRGAAWAAFSLSVPFLCCSPTREYECDGDLTYQYQNFMRVIHTF